MTARLLLSVLLLAAAGCAEMRRPPPPPPPGDLLGSRPDARVDPLRAGIEATASAFADAGLSLAEKPALAAQAAAQLEYLAQNLPNSRNYAGISAPALRDLALARDELREALGINATAPAPQVMQALLDAARALRAGQAEAAASALPPAWFRPGGTGSIRRFAEPGPLPQAARASTALREEMLRLDANRLWLRGGQQDGIGMETGTTGSGVMPGLGGGF